MAISDAEKLAIQSFITCLREGKSIYVAKKESGIYRLKFGQGMSSESLKLIAEYQQAHRILKHITPAS